MTRRGSCAALIDELHRPALIAQIYPPETKREIEEFLGEGALILAANPGAGATQLITAIASDTVVLDVREAGTPLGFRMQFARALVERAAAQLPRSDANTSLQPPVLAVLALDFGRRARDLVALAGGEGERDLTLAQIAQGLPDETVMVVDHAHLVDSVVGSEALWGMRDRRRLVLVTRPWFVERLRHSGAAFFGHGRTLKLSSAKLRVPLDDLSDVPFILERTLGNAELIAEIVRRGHGDGRRGWDEAVEARRALAPTFLSAAFAIHQFGPRLLRAIAADEPPYGAVPDGPTARVANALRALRDSDFVYPPRPRRWRLADPAMAAALRGSAS